MDLSDPSTVDVHTGNNRWVLDVGVGGIMVSIAAFQAVDPGSIPGRRNFLKILSRTFVCLGLICPTLSEWLGYRAFTPKVQVKPPAWEMFCAIKTVVLTDLSRTRWPSG